MHLSYDWQNLEILHKNRENSRSYYIPYDTAESALCAVKAKSPFYKLLNGNWNFIYYDRPIDVPDDITEPNYYDYEWGEMPVPSSWHMFGYGDSCDFIPLDDPFVPAENPVGIYSRAFILPSAWYDKRVYVNFGGVSSAFHVYINGEEAGYSQGANLPSEFDITNYLVEGENNITVKVYKYSNETYLEDQDFCRLSGILRDVYLLARDEEHVRDIVVKQTLCEKFKNGKVEIEFGGVRAAEIEIYSPSGEKIATTKKAKGKAVFELENVKKWSAETPDLYTAVIKSANEVIAQEFGFIKVEIAKNCEVLINGVEVKINGVDARGAIHYALAEDIQNELLLMKRCNINTIRTSHYQGAPEFLKLCNKLGFYVIEETDINVYTQESAAICDNPEWEKAFIERAERMLQRDKNNPCVIMWSVRNEAACGKNHIEMAKWIKNRDTLRPVQCEGVNENPALAEAADCMCLPFDLLTTGTYRYIKVSKADVLAGSVKVTNQHDFISANEYEMVWKLTADGKTLKQGKVSGLNIKPHGSRTYKLDYDIPQSCRFGCFLEIEFLYMFDTPWAKAGESAAFQQFEVPAEIVAACSCSADNQLFVEENREYLEIYGEEFTYVFNKFYGQFESIVLNGVEMLAGKSDYGIDLPQGLENKAKSFPRACSWMQKQDNSVIIETETKIAFALTPPMLTLATTYTVSPSGEITAKISGEKTQSAEYMPRFGMDFTMPETYENIKYFGMGCENMHDCPKMGMYKKTVADKHDYIQDYGFNKKYAVVYDALGRGLMFEAKSGFDFIAARLSADNFENAEEAAGLAARGETIVSVTYKTGDEPFTFKIKPVFIENCI